MNFTDKVIIITGASSGIGRALAIALAQQGAHLALAARDLAALEETAHACRELGAQVLAVQTDVTDAAQCQQCIEQTIQAWGRIDCLVNNAGVSCVSRFDEVSDLSVFTHLMQVNYLGAVYCTHAALPYIKQSQGLLVAISSLCGKTGIPLRSGYVASKHAMQGFFDTLRIELLHTGVGVLVVSPGFVATPIRQKALKGDGTLWGQSHRDEERHTMSVETCVRQILVGMSQRKREVIMTPKGKLLPWARLIVPQLVDRIAAAAVTSTTISQ
ncbi:MAG TPA: SDR family oxidoreductase [Stenomitos sp.]